LKHDASDDDGGGGGIKANETIPADLPGIDEELLSLPKPPLLSAQEEIRSRRWTAGRRLPANLVAIDGDDEEVGPASTSSRRRHNSGTISFSRPSSSPSHCE